MPKETTIGRTCIKPLGNYAERVGSLELLRRAKVLPENVSLEQAPEVDCKNAGTIVSEMDGLPLALDQAGAYIEETGCSVATYDAGS